MVDAEREMTSLERKKIEERAALELVSAEVEAQQEALHKAQHELEERRAGVEERWGAYRSRAKALALLRTEVEQAERDRAGARAQADEIRSLARRAMEGASKAAQEEAGIRAQELALDL